MYYRRHGEYFPFSIRETPIPPVIKFQKTLSTVVQKIREFSKAYLTTIQKSCCAPMPGASAKRDCGIPFNPPNSFEKRGQKKQTKRKIPSSCGDEISTSALIQTQK
jgi:hypothetical protein